MRKKRRSNLTTKQIAKIVLLMEQGVTQRHIAERFNTTCTTVRDAIKRNREMQHD